MYTLILINTQKIDLEVDLVKNMLISVFFKNKSFYIKKNEASIFKSTFDSKKLENLNNKLKKKVYYIDNNTFLQLFFFFENLFLKTKIQIKDLNLKQCLLIFDQELVKINNFNFFNIETTTEEEKEKYDVFFNVFFNFLNVYIKYIQNNILNDFFLSYFFKENNLTEIKNCINKEVTNLNTYLIKESSFKNLTFLIKTLKNILLFLKNTLEINVKDVSNNNYNSNFFLEIEYCEYIVFTSRLKILIAYSEQIITINNLKQKLDELELNKKKLFGIEIKLDFRGRVYTLSTIKAFDNNKLLRQSIRIKNSIKISYLLSWFKKIYKETNINNILNLNYDVYSYILTKKEFKEYTFILNIDLQKIKKKDFLSFLYLKTKTALLCYLGFLLLPSTEKKTYTMDTIINLGYTFFYDENLNEKIQKVKNQYNIELYLEFMQTVDALKELNQKISFNSLITNTKLLTLDSSCNGYTHLLYTFSDLKEDEFKKFKEVLNLSSSNKNFDFYSEVLNEIKEKNSFLKEQIEKKIITRTSIKKVVMTIPYNAKEYSFTEKLKKEIIEKDPIKKKKIINELILFFSKDFKNKIINKTFTLKLKEFLKKNKVKNIYYLIDDETKINLSYLKKKNKKIPYIDNVLNKKKSVYIKILTSDLDIEKTLTASIANIIHANDAFCIKELIINNKLNILTIHDCVKFNAFLFEEMLITYELIFKNFYKKFNIYEKIYFEDPKTKELKKVFNEKNLIKNENKELVFENSKYILKF